MDQRDKKGAGFEDTFSRYRRGGIGVPPPAFTPEPVCEPEGRPHRITRVLALAHKLDELVPIRRGNGPRGVGPAGPCFASAPLPVHDAPASGPGDPTVSAIAGRGQASPISEVGLRRIAREPDGIASVPFLTPYWCGSNAFGIPPPSVSALVCQLT